MLGLLTVACADTADNPRAIRSDDVITTDVTDVTEPTDVTTPSDATTTTEGPVDTGVGTTLPGETTVPPVGGKMWTVLVYLAGTTTSRPRPSPTSRRCSAVSPIR